MSFLEKFGTAFMASVELSFPDLSMDVLNNLREGFSHTVDALKSSISANNIENKFLIPLTIALLDGTLHHADY